MQRAAPRVAKEVPNCPPLPQAWQLLRASGLLAPPGGGPGAWLTGGWGVQVERLEAGAWPSGDGFLSGNPAPSPRLGSVAARKGRSQGRRSRCPKMGGLT